MQNILSLGGMHCASCATKIEEALQKQKGVESATVNFANQKAIIAYDEKLISLKKIEQVILHLGYGVIKPGEEEFARKQEQETWKWRFFIALFSTLPIFVLSHGDLIGINLTLDHEINTIAQIFFTTIIIICGGTFFVNRFKSIKPNMDTLVALGSGVAYLYSMYVAYYLLQNIRGYTVHDLYFESTGFILLFILLGKWLEFITKGKTSEAIKQLLTLTPQQAIILKEGKEITVPVDQIQINDFVVIKPGAKIPVDGIILEGNSTVDESMITGESIPVEKKKKDKVIAGTINQNGTFTFKAQKIGKDTVLSHIIQLVEQAQNSKAPIQSFVDSIARIFVPVVVILAVLVFFYWTAHESFTLALTPAIAILIIACPCAMGLATPTAVMVGSGLAAHKGILFKSSRAIQKASEIQIVVFDKTGTLTQGKTEITEMHTVHGFHPKDVIKLAAIAEKKSEHPLAKAVIKAAQKAKIEIPDPEKFQAIPGKGVIASYLHKRILVGNITFLKEKKIPINTIEEEIEKLVSRGRTILIVVVNEKIIGLFGIADLIKDDAKEAVTALQNQGKKVILLTGDNERTAQTVAHQLGIEHVIAEITPEQKYEKIKELKKEGHVAMVGDGINDAPSLAQADIGIAIGSGTDVAIEAGDIVLLRNNVMDVVHALNLGSYTVRKIKQNLFWAFAYNIIAIPIAAGVLYPVTGWFLQPWIAALAMSFSSVSVIGNALLMKIKY